MSVANLRERIRNLTRMLNKASDIAISGHGTDITLKYQVGDTNTEDITQKVLYGKLTTPEAISTTLTSQSTPKVIGQVELTCEPFGRLADDGFALVNLKNEVDGTNKNYVDLGNKWGPHIEFVGTGGHIQVTDIAALQNLFATGATFEWVMKLGS